MRLSRNATEDCHPDNRADQRCTDEWSKPSTTGSKLLPGEITYQREIHRENRDDHEDDRRCLPFFGEHPAFAGTDGRVGPA